MTGFICNEPSFVTVAGEDIFSGVPATNKVPLVIITGESNSGGYAVNADALPAELLPRPQVQILNNNTLLFESLDIGTNNLIGHAGLPENATHGLELGLCNSVVAGEWAENTIYLVKTGQGASRISDWDEGDGYWITFLARVDAALALIEAADKIPVIYVLYSQGINDALASFDASAWKLATIAHLEKIRVKLGPVPILMTRLMSPTYDAYNAKIDEIAASNDLNFAISVTGASLRDTNHWDYEGMKLIASRMVDEILNTIGEGESYTQFQASALWEVLLGGGGAPGGGGGGGGEELGAEVFAIWDGSAGTTPSGDFLVNTGGAGGVGGRATLSIDATQAFEVNIYHNLADHAETNAVVVILDDDNTAYYAWAGDQSFIIGCYQYGDDFYCPVGGYGAPSLGVTGFPSNIKFVKDGDDILVQQSLDNITFDTISTAVGVLSGKTNIYLKIIFAVGSGRTKVGVKRPI